MSDHIETMAIGQKEEVAQPENHSLETPSIDMAEEMSCAKIFGLRVEELSPKEKQMLSEVYQWAKETTGKDGDPMWALISKRNQLGTPIAGDSYLARIYQWVKQYQITRQEEEKLKLLETNG